MALPTEKDLLAALSTVHDPELHKDLVTLEMIKNLKVHGDGAVSLMVELTTPACPLKGQIEKDVLAALKKVAGVSGVDLTWGARVRGGAAAPNGILPLVKNVILVGAGKGGVGKSTVALNLATSLAKQGAKVGLLDADFYGPSVPIMTGVKGRPTSRDGKTLEPLEAHGLKLMSIGFLIDADQATVWRGPMIHGALLQLLRDVNWGELDYLVLDLPPGTGDVPLSLSQTVKAAGVVLVSTPQDVALADVVKAKTMFDKVSVPVLGIVENMSDFVCPHCATHTPIFSTGGTERAAAAMGISFLGKVPLDLKIRESGDAGVPLVAAHPESPQAKAFLDVSRAVAGRVSVATAGVRLPVFGGMN